MEIISNITELSLKGSSVALGKFDGVHLGHQAIIEELKRENTGGKKIVITFSVSPQSLLSGIKGSYLMTEKEKIDYFETMGIDALIDIKLTREFLNCTAEQFVQDMLVEHLGIKKLVCGREFRFGKGRAGNVELLRKLGERYGFATGVVPPVMLGEERVSSTRIRKALIDGNLDLVNRMLGRPYGISGIVRHGRALGRTMDFPTVNLIPDEEKILPPLGVYRSECSAFGQKYPSVTNIGKKPTVGDHENVTVETHLLDYAGDLYGQEITVELLSYLRPEKKFDSLEALKKQIRTDVHVCRGLTDFVEKTNNA